MRKEPPFRPIGKPDQAVWAMAVDPNRRSLMDDLRDSRTVPTQGISEVSAIHLPVKYPNHSFLVMAHDRFGVQGFMVELEMTLFPPSTSKNDDLQVVITDWQKMDWMIAFFPNHYREAAEAIALKWKLLFREYGAIPHVVWWENGVQKVEKFPIAARDNVYTLEGAEGASPDLNRKFLEVDRELRIKWANSLPMHGARVLGMDDATADGTHLCTVCHKLLRVGDVVALIGEEVPRLSTHICLDHLSVEGKGKK